METERQKDPTVWISSVCRQINITESNSPAPHRVQFWVTDWRFPDESEYVLRTMKNRFNISTLRLFRSDVIAGPNEKSEHNNDGLVTDFLLVPSEAEFDIAKERFPQYADYQRLLWILHA